MINTVFLDVDGVLANFRKGVHEAFNKPYDYFMSPENKTWDFWNIWPDVTFEMVNNICTINFWANLEWMHDGHDILRIVLNKFNINQIYLLTTPMPNVKSPTGRWLWIKNNLPKFYKRTIITRAPKSLLARPDTLLIDDKSENIDGFKEAGGQGLIVPRAWNYAYLYADKTVKFVEDFLKDII